MKGAPSRTGALRGTSVVEALVALLLTSFLLQAAWALAAEARRTVSRLVERSEALDTERVGWHVLSAELAAGLHGRDWGVEGEWVVPLRAFRGVGEVCPGSAVAGGAVLRYRGTRLPEPDKDSLLLLDAGGGWRAVRLAGRGVAGSGCSGPGSLERWTWDPPVEGAVVARLFERGSYHLDGDALRYRIGAGGRQPLTPERLDPSGTGVAGTPGGALELRLGVRTRDGEARAWTRRLWQEPWEDG